MDRRHSSTPSPQVIALVQSAQSSGEIDHYPGKRSAIRITEALQIEFTTDPSGEKILSATMHNVSETGCSFWSRKKMDRGYIIFVREFSPECPNGWIQARVTHCTQGVQGFLIGACFEPQA